MQKRGLSLKILDIKAEIDGILNIAEAASPEETTGITLSTVVIVGVAVAASVACCFVLGAALWRRRRHNVSITLLQLTLKLTLILLSFSS